jgi:hypothetical protein
MALKLNHGSANISDINCIANVDLAKYELTDLRRKNLYNLSLTEKALENSGVP